LPDRAPPPVSDRSYQNISKKEADMNIRWDRLFQTEREQFEKMDAQQKYQYFLLLQYGSPYGWGKENPVESDCSGAVCLAIYAATGLLVRTTADDLYRRFFTIANPSEKMIRAVFWLTRQEGMHGDRKVLAGTATHVAGIVGRGAVLSSEEPGAVVSTVMAVPSGGRTTEVRGLDMEYLKYRQGKDVYDLDDVFQSYFEG
jgi:murein DD-endopeptidase